MHLNIINELKRLNIISWYAILLALEKRWVTKKDIEDYSVYLLNFPDFYNDNVAILANALSYSDDEVKDQILQLCEEIQFNKNDETQKLKLAALCYLVNSNILKKSNVIYYKNYMQNLIILKICENAVFITTVKFLP